MPDQGQSGPLIEEEDFAQWARVLPGDGEFVGERELSLVAFNFWCEFSDLAVELERARPVVGCQFES